MGFCRQEYWSGLPFPSPGDLPGPGIEPGSPAFQADALTSELPGKPWVGTIKKCPLCDKVIDLLKLVPGGSDSKASAYNVGNPGLIPGSGISSGEGNGNPL